MSKSSDTETPLCNARRRLFHVRDTTAMIWSLDGLTSCYADQLYLDGVAELRNSFMITRSRRQPDQYDAIADVGPFPIKKGRTL